MKVSTVYICEICNTEYYYKEEAEQCEAQPIVEPDWIKIGLEKGFYGFGEFGVEFFEKGKVVRSRLDGNHHRLLYGAYGLSHNQVDKEVHLNVLHPYYGWDFLRYVDEWDLSLEMEKWKKACQHYEIEPDLSKCTWLERFGSDINFINTLEEKRKQQCLEWLSKL